MSAAQAATAAKHVNRGSPEGAAACELCIMRGFNPDEIVASVKAGIPRVTNWQWILAEQILEQQLRIILAKSAGPSFGLPVVGHG